MGARPPQPLPAAPAAPAAAPAAAAKTVNVLGLEVMPLSANELNEAIFALVRARAHAVIPNVNAHFANLAFRRPWLRDFFNQAPINFCDGHGIVLAARILGRPLPARITYADYLWDLCRFAAGHGLSFFFLGGEPGRAAQSAAILRQAIPALRILAARHGRFDKGGAGGENESTIAGINRCRPDILLVGFGMPLQERWLLDNWQKIDARVALTGGGVFDFISGRRRRAPRWMRERGLEWLWRLLLEPGRLWRRYLVGNPLFLWRVLAQKRSERRRQRRGGDETPPA